MWNGFISSIEHFKPHTFQAEQGEGLFRSHSHDFAELTLILDGEGYYSSQEQNINVSKGILILIPPKLHHGFVCIKPWRGVSLHFLFDNIPAFCQYLFLCVYKKPLHILVSQLDEKHLAWANICLQQLELEWKVEVKYEHSYDLMRNILETILLLFHKNIITPQLLTEKTDASLIIQQVLREIHQRYNTSIKINEIASRHFLSESILRRKFLAIMGVSPKQYIINLRLEEAKRLLKQTNKTIEYISSEVGFTSSSRFYNLFVKSIGITPLEWRKQNQ